MRIVKCKCGYCYDADCKTACPECGAEKERNNTILKEEQCQLLYAFEHKFIPQSLFNAGEDFALLLLVDHGFVFRHLDEAFQKNGIQNPYGKEQLSANAYRILDGLTAVRIVFPEPQRPPLCYYIYVIWDKEFTRPAVFCVEKGGDYSGEKPFLCEWSEEGAHINHGNCDLDEEASFRKCISVYLRSEYNGTPSLIEDFQAQNDPEKSELTEDSESTVDSWGKQLVMMAECFKARELLFQICSGENPYIENPYIEIPYKGDHCVSYKIKVYLNGAVVALSSEVITDIPENKDEYILDTINNLNQTYRHVKFFLNGERSLEVFSSVPKIIPDEQLGEVAYELVRKISCAVDDSYPELMDAINKDIVDSGKESKNEYENSDQITDDGKKEFKLMRCELGQFYDGNRFAKCPHCTEEKLEELKRIVKDEDCPVQCEQGHTYNSNLYESCPVCRGMNDDDQDVFEFLEFSHGAYFNGYQTWVINANDSLYDIKHNWTFADDEGLKGVSLSEWIDKIEKLRIYDWNSRYDSDENILDGYEWSIKYKAKNKKIKEVYVYVGDHTPDNWQSFLDCFDELDRITYSLKNTEQKTDASEPEHPSEKSESEWNRDKQTEVEGSLDISSIDSFLGDWRIGKKLGEGWRSDVYEIARTESDDVYFAALKIIDIPRNRSELKEILEGMTREDAIGYYQSIVDDLVEKLEFQRTLQEDSGIMRIEDYQVLKSRDEISWKLLVRTELLTPLNDYCLDHELSREDVVRLGVDICKSLSVCEENNILHGNIKSSEFFITGNGNYKLGDLCFAHFGNENSEQVIKIDLSRFGRKENWPPEVYNKGEYYQSGDVYSLGLILYRFLNRGRLPFYPKANEKVTFALKEEAFEKRMKGEELFPQPEGCPDDLFGIIQKACAFNPAERFSSAKEMQKELEHFLEQM